MEERLKVFIRGVKGRGKEVIETLTNLGAENVWNYCGSFPGHIYFIGYDGVLDNAEDDSKLARLVMEYCREIKLPEQLMDGAVLINDDSHMYAVFSHIDVESTFIAYMQASEDGAVSYENGVRCNMEDYRLATDEEVERFYELLHKHGKEWDDEKKILVEWKWEPKIGVYYFFLSSDLSFGNTPNDGLPIDVGRIRCGNCFRTREEAEAMAEKIKKLLNGE